MPRVTRPVLLFVVAVFASAGPAACQPPAGNAPPPTPPASPTVETAATPKTRLYVKTLPPGATVTLDGRPLGPSDGLFIVPAGTGKVSVQFDGAAPQVQEVEIADGLITRVEFTRTPAAPAAAAAGDGAGGSAFGGMGTGSGAAGFGDPLQSVRLQSNKPVIEAKPLSKLDAALLAPAPPLGLQETPLRDAVRQIAAAAKVEILLDQKALEEAGIDLATPVTADVGSLPLASALAAVLMPLDLVAIVRDDLLEVTTGERGEDRMFVHVYDVSDLTADDAGLQGLIDLVTTLIEPDSWTVVGGAGEIRPDRTLVRKALVVSQSWPRHWRIARFLAALRRLKAQPAAERRPLAADGYWSDAASAVAAQAALEKPVDVSFQDVPLREAMFQLSKPAGVPIGLDMRALEEQGVDFETPVTFALAGRPLAVVLDRLLDPLDLTLDLAGDRLLVTTEDQAEQRLSTAIYPLPLDSRDHVDLVDTIQNTIGGPAAWADTGGTGAIVAIEGSPRCLVIRQTTANHRAIAALLRSLE